MNTGAIAIRALQYGAAMLLFGASVFPLYAPRQSFRAAADAGLREWRHLRGAVFRLQCACLVVVVVSGVAWYALETAAMSGLPLDRALSGPAPGTVLHDTVFGRIAAVRLVLALVLGALLFRGRGVVDAAHRFGDDAARAALAGALLLVLAGTGHAAGTRGADRYIHLIADSGHLLAAGGWLGALPPLALLLVRAARKTSASRAVLAVETMRRFSRFGVLCVGALLLTGSINTWYLAGSVEGVFGTPWGRLLLLKLTLFAVMVAVAAGNRYSLMPRTNAAPGDGADARRIAALRGVARNAALETALGLSIVAIVGALGVAIPAAHAEIVWPFPFTLDWTAVDDRPYLRVLVIALFTYAIAAPAFAAPALAARRRRGFRVVAGLVVSSAAALGVAGYLLAVPAYPTTYASPPIRYTAASIVRGSALFSAQCATCHGKDGYGDGPAAASLAVRPANLAARHVQEHRPGELFWRLSHGIDGTSMPGFAERLTVPQRWDVVNFLRAKAQSEDAMALSTNLVPLRPIIAPDFTFEIDRGSQETLNDQRRAHVVLLAFYTLPASRARLAAFAAGRAQLDRSGVRVIALPMSEPIAATTDLEGLDRSMLAIPDAVVSAAYALFVRARSASSAPGEWSHVEFLIDRQGCLRARWLGPGAPEEDPVREVLRASFRLPAEPACRRGEEAGSHGH